MQRNLPRALARYWQQSIPHQELIRARLALALVLALAVGAVVGYTLGASTDAIMKFVVIIGTISACLSIWHLSRTRKFERLAAVLLRFRVTRLPIDDAIQYAAHTVIATSEYACFVLALAHRTARIASTTVRAHVGTCALVLTPRIAAAPRFAALIPAA